MFYEIAVNVPANTLASNPVIQTLKVDPGVINHVELEFEAGCHGMVKAAILYQDHQLYPTNPDGFFSADGYVIRFDDWFELETEPYELKLVFSSAGSSYAHVITVRIGVTSNDQAQFVYQTMQGIQKLLGLVGVQQ